MKVLRWFTSRPGTLALALVVALSLASSLRAQPPNETVPDDSMNEPAADEPADSPADADMPADEAPVADDMPAAEEDAPAAFDEDAPARPRRPAEGGAPTIPDSPAVRTILESKPKTPADLLRNIIILTELGYSELARPYVDELTARKLDLATQAGLVDRFNTARLMKLARNPELQELLSPWVDQLLVAAETYHRDSKLLAQRARQLSGPDADARATAHRDLRRAGEAAVAPLVATLADPKRAAEWPAARQMLVSLDDLAIAPLVGTLESPDAALNAQTIEILGQLRATQALPMLFYPLLAADSTPALRSAAATAIERIVGRPVGSDEALRMLEVAVRRPLEQSRRQDDDPAVPRTVWLWDAKRGESVPVTLDTASARALQASRLARGLYRLGPGSVTLRRLYLVAALQAEKYRAGLANPLPTAAGSVYRTVAQFGPEVVEDALAVAMAGNYIPAATGAAQILGDIGSRELLLRGAQPSTLVTAAAHADRRLRFAATRAVMQLGPLQPFAGSSHVAEGLAFFASSQVAPRVLVVHPRSDQAQLVAGLAMGLGFDADIATNGRDAFKLAVASPDYQYILIHSVIQNVQVDDLLKELRRDSRTAALPIGFMAPPYDLERVQRFASHDARATAFLQPQRSEEMQIFNDDLLALAGRSRTGDQEREQQAIAALDWIDLIGRKHQHVFDMLHLEGAVAGSLFVPDRQERAIDVLSRIGTATSQQNLLAVANLGAQSLAARQSAVRALASSVQRFGLLLVTDEIRRQFDLYNANGGKDADASLVLGEILDVIEGKYDGAVH